MWNRLIWLLSFLPFLFLAGVCPAQEEPTRGGTFRYGETRPHETLDPVTSNCMESLRLCELMFESLVATDENGAYYGQLAEDKWIVSPDKRSITFKLRKGVEWVSKKIEGGAHYFTAYDVIATINVVNHPNTIKSSYLKANMSNIQSWNIVDDYTIEFRLVRPCLSPEALFTFKILPAHCFAASELYINKMHPLAHNPVGTGVYRMMAEKGDEVVLKLNTSHRPHPAHIENVKMIRELDRGLLQGKLDGSSIDAVIDIPTKDIAKYVANAKFNILPYNSMSFDYLGFNMKHPLLAQKEFRQALTMAIDRQKILTYQYQGMGQLISGPYPPSSPYLNPDVPVWPYDENHAKALLDKLGYLDRDGDGKREYMGKSIELEIKVPVASSAPENVASETAEQIRANWERIGVTLKIEPVEYSQLRVDLFSNKSFDVSYQSWNFDDANDVSSLFLTGSDNNYVSYSNSEVDAILRLLKDTQDPEEQRDLNRRLHRILREECPYIFLWTLDKYAVVNKRIKRAEKYHPFRFFSFIDQWYILSVDQAD